MYIAQLGAPVDTAAVVAVVKDFVAGGIPWLDPRVTDWLAQLILAVPIVPTILAWKGVAAKVREWSPWVNEHFGKKFERFAFILNPILAGLIAGGVFGDSTIGFAATALWAMGESAVKQLGPKAPTAAGIAKGRALGTILGVGLSLALCASVGHAKTLPGFTVDEGVAVDAAPAPSILERLSWGVGTGVRFEAEPGANLTVGYALGSVGFVWNDHVNLKARLWRDAEQAPKGGGAVEVLWVW